MQKLNQQPKEVKRHVEEYVKIALFMLEARVGFADPRATRDASTQNLLKKCFLPYYRTAMRLLLVDMLLQFYACEVKSAKMELQNYLSDF